MQMQEIFGRFVLVERLDDRRDDIATFRAVDPERALKPLVVVQRTPGDAVFAGALSVAAMDHRNIASNLVSDPIDDGIVGSFVWRARAWLPGVPVSALCFRFTDVEAPPLSVGLTLAYLVGFVTSDAQKNRHGAKLLPLPTRCIVGVDGVVRLTTTTIDGRDATDGWLRRLALTAHSQVQLRVTPATTAAVVCSALLRDEVPSELARLVRLTARGHVELDEFIADLKPIMEAAGGGSYRQVSEWLKQAWGGFLRQQASVTNAELELAQRMRNARARRRGARDNAMTTQRLRIRPASKEGPARLVRTPVPKDMVLVSGGRYLFSASDAGDAEGYVDVKPFLFDRTPVTWAAYARFCQTGIVKPPDSWPAALRAVPSAANVPARLRRTPVTGISHDDAEAFARFVGKRLATETEWELAGRGFDGRLWPYGHELDDNKARRRWRRDRDPDEITKEDLEVTSPFGVSLLGYAWEWTSTPAGELADSAWVVRGGAWRDSDEPPTLLNRSREVVGASDVMFRCALDFDADAPDEDALGHLDTDEGDAVTDDTDEGA